jgi:hypothetical protein
LLTSWSRVLLDKLIVVELLRKIPAFDTTGKFIAAFTKAATGFYPELYESSLMYLAMETRRKKFSLTL